MKIRLALTFGVVALLGLFGVTIAEIRTEATETEVDVLSDESVLVQSEDTDGRVRSIVPVQPTYRDQHPQRARGLKIRPDGVTMGRIFYIDRSSLTLSPVQNARIGVLQNRRVVAQALTDEQGVFTVAGLTPWAVYSVTAASEQWISVFSAVIIPEDDVELQALDASDQNQDRWINDIRLVAAGPSDDTDAEESPSSEPAGEAFFTEESVAQRPEAANPPAQRLEDGGLQEVDAQAIPRENFIVALRAGLFGTDVCGLPPGLTNPCCDMAGGLAGGGGAGGGGGGGGGGGLGGALIGAGVGAAIGAAAGSDSGSAASPFAP